MSVFAALLCLRHCVVRAARDHRRPTPSFQRLTPNRATPSRTTTTTTTTTTLPPSRPQVYGGAHISGGCYNPAIALTRCLAGALGPPGTGLSKDFKKDWPRFGLYVLVEMVGGLLGAILGYLPRPENSGIACPAPHAYFHEGQMALNEFLWCTALCYVALTVLCTGETKDTVGKHYYGFCIGFTVGVAVLFSSLGGSYNPAVGTGLLIAAAINSPDNDTCSDDNFKYIWIYLLAPMVGAVAGWGLHRLTNGEHYGDGRFNKVAPFLQEFLGTFYLCLTIGMTSLPSAGGGLAPLGIGTILAIFVYCGGHVSGGQYNPSVSLGVFIRGAQSVGKMFAYIACQLLGAIAGAFVAYLQTRYASSEGAAYLDTPGATALVPVAPHIEGNSKTDLGGVLLGEFVVTFALVFTVLSTATGTSEKVTGNSYFGIAIGWTVTAGAYAVGTWTGGAFNPAAWTGLNLVYAFHEDGNPWADIWAFWVAHLLAGLVAGLFYRVVRDVQAPLGTVAPAFASPA